VPGNHYRPQKVSLLLFVFYFLEESAARLLGLADVSTSGGLLCGRVHPAADLAASASS
jgi:hypothetical protein